MSNYPGENHVKITDKWFDDNPNSRFDIESTVRGRPVSHGKDNFRPMGILINSNGASAQATTAVVSGYLHNENEKDVDEYVLALNVVHRLAFKAIYEKNTTARGVKIFA